MYVSRPCPVTMFCHDVALRVGVGRLDPRSLTWNLLFTENFTAFFAVNYVHHKRENFLQATIKRDGRGKMVANLKKGKTV